MKKIISGIIAGAVLCSTITMNFKFDNSMTINAESKEQLAYIYNGHSYYIYDGVASTWDEAKEFCKNRGGYLAVINDGKENEALFDFVKSSGYNNVYFGYTDKVNEGNWNWVVMCYTERAVDKHTKIW